MEPLVSVIISTFRRQKELLAALISLKNQTMHSFEIIIVDDNGNKEWNKKIARLVAQFAAENPSIRLHYVVNPSNQGSAKTRNTGISVASGKYITFLDDDIYLPDKLLRQVEFMQKWDLDYSITDLELYNEKGKLVDRRTRSFIRDTDVNSLTRYHLKYNLTGTDTMMFTKEYMKSIGGFAHFDVGDEFYLMQRAINGGGKFGYLPKCDVKATVHKGHGGLSSGCGKIEGENRIYQYKRSFFQSLSSADIKFIRMRHYAVLAVAYFKMKKPAFVVHLFHSFLISPILFVKLFFGRKT